LKKLALAFACLAAASLSGCVALLAGAGGATAVACTEKELDCPVD